MIGLNWDTSLNLYSVDWYGKLDNEQYPTWHTLRTFRGEGEAKIFVGALGHADYERLKRYAKSFRKNAVVVRVKLKDDNIILKTETL